jgi:transcriptional regulator NrdR family protein
MINMITEYRRTCVRCGKRFKTYQKYASVYYDCRKDNKKAYKESISL